MALLSVKRVFLAITLACALTGGQELDEYVVKSAFLYNFARFVEWPSGAFKGPGDPVSICVVGENPFGQSLELATAGKLVLGRRITVRQVSDVRYAAGCHIIYISSSLRRRLKAVLSDCKLGTSLTVGDYDGFTEAGGMVNLRLDGGTVHFEINAAAAQEQGLQISSKLLSLARKVKE